MNFDNLAGSIKAKLTKFVEGLPEGTESSLIDEAGADVDALAKQAGDAAISAVPQIPPELAADWNSFIDQKTATIVAEAQAKVATLTAAKIAPPPPPPPPPPSEG